MKVASISKSKTLIMGNQYILEINRKNLENITLQERNGKAILKLFVLSSCNASGMLDKHTYINKIDIKKINKAIEITLLSRSSLWDEKKYVLVCRDGEIEYYFRVKGNGKISDCMFWQGYKEKLCRSIGSFEYIFNPQPNGDDYRYFYFHESTRITVTNDDAFPGYRGGDWFFIPPPFCYVFGDRDKKKWISVGLVVRPGEYNFIKYEYHGGKDWGLNLTYEEHTQVKGYWESPHILFQFSNNEYQAVTNYVDWLRDNKIVNIPKQIVPSWWREPIFCAWGEQLYYVYLSGNTSRDIIYSTQSNYERHLNLLEKHGINPGIVVIESRWNAKPGSPLPDMGKWPEMREFIDKQHNKKRHVLLWYGTWREHRKDYDKMSKESITKNGDNLICDPSHPEFEEYLRKFIRVTLSPDKSCLNADGYKIDLIGETPSGKGIKTYGHIWGVELLKRYLAIIYEEAKKVKPDALIETHTPNPYFAEVTDMIRLNDIYTTKKPTLSNIIKMMTHRSKIAKIGYPGHLIDCDNAPMSNRRVFIEYMKLQPSLGNPSLYYVTHISGDGSKIRKKDYELIKKIWNDYKKKKN